MTDPAKRGKGLYKNCQQKLAGYLFENGAEKLMQMVEYDNLPVLHTLPKLGYKKTKVISHVTVFGIKYTATLDLADGRTRRSIFLRIPRAMYIV
jgi:hypothetical protein